MDSLRSLLVDSKVFDFSRKNARSCRITGGRRKVNKSIIIGDATTVWVVNMVDACALSAYSNKF